MGEPSRERKKLIKDILVETLHAIKKDQIDDSQDLPKRSNQGLSNPVVMLKKATFVSWNMRSQDMSNPNTQNSFPSYNMRKGTELKLIILT